jgi:PhoH-like ATPase
VLERRQHKKVVVFRPLFAVGGQELGYLPAARTRRCRPGARRSSTRSAPHQRRTSSTRCSTAACSRCCR